MKIFLYELTDLVIMFCSDSLMLCPIILTLTFLSRQPISQYSFISMIRFFDDADNFY